MLKFRLNTQQVFLTYPKCPIIPKDALTFMKVYLKEEYNIGIQKYVIAQEKHMDDSLHLHMYLKLSQTINFKNPSCFDLYIPDDEEKSKWEKYHGNYQSCRSANAVIKYCVKGGLYISNMDKEIEKANNKEEKMNAMEELIKGNMEIKDFVSLYPSMNLLGSYSRLKANLTALRLDLRPLPRRQQVCGKWLIGEPGVGKSHLARTVTEGNLFVKLQTKWWCGYAGQKYVLLEDLSKPGPHSALPLLDLAYYLKIWTDKWDSVGETKGGANVPLAYSSFWVSSNYTIEEIFEGLEDRSLLAAIKRRFVVMSIISSDEIGNIEKPKGYEDSVTQQMIEKKMNPSKSPDPLPQYSLWGSVPFSPDLQNGGDESSLSRIFKP